MMQEYRHTCVCAYRDIWILTNQLIWFLKWSKASFKEIQVTAIKIMVQLLCKEHHRKQSACQWTFDWESEVDGLNSTNSHHIVIKQ